MTDPEGTDEGLDDAADEATAKDEATTDMEDEGGHALPIEDLRYPEFVFEEGDIDWDGGFALSKDANRDEMGEWLRDLADGLTSHDVAVESPDGHVTFGVGPKDVEMRFDPDENLRGELEITFRLNAKAMFVADDPSKPKVGARGGRGFVPLEMLTTDRERFRCYNWIDDPTDP